MEFANGKSNQLIYRKHNNRYHVDDEKLDENNLNQDLSILSKSIQDQTIVLDVGCAQGKLGELLKTKKKCTIYGVEINDDAIAYTRKAGFYEDIFKFNIEDSDESNPEYIRYCEQIGQLDYVVLSNVLEHLIDPTATLIEMGKKLRMGGKILVCVPNIAHADISLHLLDGIFNYTEMGILDNSHLKFFTKQSFFQWIDDYNDYFSLYNYDCAYLGSTFYYSDYLNEIKSSDPLLYQIIQANPEFNVFQNLFLLTKIECGGATPELQKQLVIPSVSVTSILENALHAVYPIGESGDGLYKVSQGERLLYEAKLNASKDHIKLLESANEELGSKAAAFEEKSAYLEERCNAYENKSEYLEQHSKVLEEKLVNLEDIETQYKLLEKKVDG